MPFTYTPGQRGFYVSLTIGDRTFVLGNREAALRDERAAQLSVERDRARKQAEIEAGILDRP